jgi:hypothetical protein
MKLAIFLATAIVFALVGTAAADIEEFHVDLNPAVATFRYEVPGLANGSLNCGPDPFVCEFGLDLDMRLQLDELGHAKVAVDWFALHGPERALGGDPLSLALFRFQVMDQLTSPEFFVAAGSQPGETRFTASYPMGDDLVLEFDRARLISMSGGPDYRPADGAKYTFAYTVPEPSTFALALIAALGCGRRCIARRGGTR